jgi:lipid-A-disaccharide synthase
MPSAFILAGEASGDRIGAALIAGMRDRAGMSVTGVGGEAMERQGLTSLFPIDDLAVMGYADVVARLPLLFWRAHQVVRYVIERKPDIVVLIDAQVFSEAVASRLRKRGYKGRIVLYVAPSVWATKPGRAKRIAPLYDEVLSVLPFEPAAMQRLGGPPTSYVGHPALARFPFRTYQPERGPLLLLPGSRKGELRRHLPLMREVASALQRHRAVTRFVVPTLSSLHGLVVREVAQWPATVDVVSTESTRLQALSDAVAAFAVSGTATLELALAGVPHALTYVAEPHQVRLFEGGDTAFIGLPNIVARREIVPEVLFVKKAEPAKAISAVKNLLDKTDARAAQAAGFAEIRALMEKGAPEAPLTDPVDRILKLL